MNPLSSLGVGSGGVLNYDIIDKLKKVDENSQIAPIDKKIQDNFEKQTEIVALTTMLNSLKANSKKLVDYSSYLGRSASSSNENSLKVNVIDGVPTQNINVKIDNIAKNSVNEFGMKFASRDSKFSTSNTTFNFHLNGNDYEINISSSDTIEDVVQKIIDGTGGLVNASIMKTGEGEGSFSLMINSKETGTNNNIYFGVSLSSNEIDDNLELGEGDFTISLKDSDGVYKTFNIVGSSYDTLGLKDSIINTLKLDPSVANLIDRGDINIILSGDGKRITLNDTRGFEINLDGVKAKNIFSKTSTKKAPTIVGDTPILSGKLEGSLSVNGNSIDIGSLTSINNSAKDNATAIADTLSAMGFESSINDNGSLVINSIDEIIIKADNEELLAKLGLKSGAFSPWALLKDKFNIKNIQLASDASFFYNGVNVTRSSNVIDDVVSGVTLELLAPSEEEIHVNVGASNDVIVEEIKGFVENYNVLIPKLDELTKYDEDTKIAGIFNGMNDIKSIKSSLNRALTKTIWSDSYSESINSYGLSFNDSNLLVLDESKLQSALALDSSKVIDFFRGSKSNVNGKEIENKGIFTLISDELDGLTTGPNARLKLLEDSFVSDDKRLKEDRKKSIEMLDKKYETMAAKFAAYDSQIAKANNSFNSLNMLIEQSIADKKNK